MNGSSPDEPHGVQLMGSFNSEVGYEDSPGSVGRREFLRKAVVGSGAFAVPTIITVGPADARALTSPPPEPPGRPQSPSVDQGSEIASPPGTPQGRRDSGTRMTRRTELPRTGMDLDRLVVAGLAATAGGAALVLWSADACQRRVKSDPLAAGEN
jgi:hypothetical protein